MAVWGEAASGSLPTKTFSRPKADFGTKVILGADATGPALLPTDTAPISFEDRATRILFAMIAVDTKVGKAGLCSSMSLVEGRQIASLRLEGATNVEIVWPGESFY